MKKTNDQGAGDREADQLGRREAMYRVAGGLGAAFSLAANVEISHAQERTAPSPRKPGTVQTVRGVIDASKLGYTLTHEHLCASSAGYWQAWPEYFGGRANFIAKIVAKLKAAKAGGVDTIADCTAIDLGRDIRLIEECSRKSGMNIIACTGHWLDPSRSMSARTIEELNGFFVMEIEKGIEGTGIKPGFIKMATDREGVTPFLEKALRAGARTAKSTGVPIITHTFAPGRIGEKQADIFESEGLSPSLVCLGHSDDTDNMEYLLGLAKRGYTVGMDRIPYGLPPPAPARAAADDDGGPPPPPAAPRPGFVTWQKRCECIKGLVDAGYVKQIFLGHDWGMSLSLGPTEAMSIEARDRANPDGILFNTRKTIPYLKQIGVSDSAIHTITVDNPRRFFGGLQT